MRAKRWAVRLFILNLALLGTHEIDSAYWHEWTMFRLPGGIQLFLVLNLGLLLVFLLGLARLADGSRSGPWYSLALAVTGVITVGLHSAFLLAGSPEFRFPASLAVLATVLPVSVALGWQSATMIRLRSQGEADGRGRSA